MSYIQNAPWTPSEKVDLLVNVLRSTVSDLPYFLMQVLNEKGIYPKWNDTPLPAGRSLAASQIAYEEMSRPFKQQGAYNVQPVGVSHVSTIAPALPSRRPFSEYEPYGSLQQLQQQAPTQPQQQQQLQQQRTLQPRPPRSTDSPAPAVTNGEGPTIIRPIAMTDPAQEPQKKKRGRPSKEEAEERDRALAAVGKVYQPKKRPAKKIRPSLETPTSVRSSEFTPLNVQTPPSQAMDTKEESSSGKRKSKRQPREESAPSEEVQGHSQRHESPQPEAQSPSDRLLAPHRDRDLDMLLTKDVSRSPAEKSTKVEETEQ